MLEQKRDNSALLLVVSHLLLNLMSLSILSVFALIFVFVAVSERAFSAWQILWKVNFTHVPHATHTSHATHAAHAAHATHAALKATSHYCPLFARASIELRFVAKLGNIHELVDFHLWERNYTKCMLLLQDLKGWASLDACSSVSHRWRTFTFIFNLQLTTFSALSDFQHVGISNETFR